MEVQSANQHQLCVTVINFEKYKNYDSNKTP